MNFEIPKLPKWGTPEWVAFQIAVERGKAAMQAALDQRLSEVERLQRLYDLQSPK